MSAVHLAAVPVRRTTPGYDVVTRLATGGMAEVLLALRAGAPGDRPVVLKRMLEHLQGEPSYLRMFREEARALQAIHHPNVVCIYELLDDPAAGECTMVLEYLPGVAASRLARRLRGADAQTAAFIVAEAAAGLHAAHTATGADGCPLNLVHRDVSPQNVVITWEGEVKLLDFGVARYDQRELRTETGVLKGKAAYMSPEQIEGQPLDHRSDLFSLGVVLHELLTGARLFARASGAATLKAVLDAPIVPPSSLAPSALPGLDAICERALRRDPAERYQSADEMRVDLLEVLSGDEPRAHLIWRLDALFREERHEQCELLRRASQAESSESARDEKTEITPAPSLRQELSSVEARVALQAKRGGVTRIALRTDPDVAIARARDGRLTRASSSAAPAAAGMPEPPGSRNGEMLTGAAPWESARLSSDSSSPTGLAVDADSETMPGAPLPVALPENSGPLRDGRRPGGRVRRAVPLILSVALGAALAIAFAPGDSSHAVGAATSGDSSGGERTRATSTAERGDRAEQRELRAPTNAGVEVLGETPSQARDEPSSPASAARPEATGEASGRGQSEQVAPSRGAPRPQAVQRSPATLSNVPPRARIRFEPSHARVLRGGEPVCKASPCSLRLTEPFSVSVEARGYRSQSLTIAPGDEREIRLRRRPRRRPASGVRRARRAEPSGAMQRSAESRGDESDTPRMQPSVMFDRWR